MASAAAQPLVFAAVDRLRRQLGDGYLCIAVLGERVWQRFCDAIERPDLALDPRLGTGTLRSKAMDGELGEIVEAWVSGRTREEAVHRLVAFGVPAGVVATPFDVIDSPQTAARSIIWDVPSYTGGRIKAVGSPIRMEPPAFAEIGSIPSPGEHTREVLARLGGFAEDEIARLMEQRVVAGPGG